MGGIAGLGSDASDISHRAKKGSDHQQAKCGKEDRIQDLADPGKDLAWP